MPALILSVAGLIAMLFGLFVRKGAAAVGAVIGLVGVLIALMANTPLRCMNMPSFNGMIALDSYTWFFNVLILVSLGLTVLISMKYLVDQGLDFYEYFALLLFSAVGMMFMASANPSSDDLRWPGNIVHRRIRSHRYIAKESQIF